jgi:hypothetical protein
VDFCDAVESSPEQLVSTVSIGQRRKPGRPLTRQDKNGRPMPVRADRDRLMKGFFEAVPRGPLEEAMQVSGDKKFYRLYDALHDDAYRNTSPGTLCRKFGISWLDLMDLWRKYNRDLGMMIMANHLPQVLDDISVDALRRECVCPRCDGVGQVGETGDTRPCPVCDGRRTIWVPGDPTARKLVLAVMRLKCRQTNN